MRVRTIIALLAICVLSLPAAAGPGSWQAGRYGADETEPAPPGTGTGNASVMEVSARPLLTKVKCFASTDPFSADEAGVATQCNTSWYSLTFVGSANAVGHRWRITTNILGSGNATANSSLAAKSWGESIELIKFAGDNDNEDVGQLAVQSGAGTSVSLSIPAGFSVSLRKFERQVEYDTYQVKSPKTTAGGGKVCRVRVDTFVKAQVAASCSLGVSSAFLLGDMTGDLDMVGVCDYQGIPITDTLRIRFDTHTMASSTTDAPSGGIEDEPGIPTDEPTPEERENPEDDRPEVDAEDLPDDWGHELEDAPETQTEGD